eukprot:NODE_1696_length_1411_cov_3.823988_g1610_i0.p2 GENE.NODE_1696_length_1411_cov_3.823988_g1610_i0~~NODE_1696_length_1411_cov_3.823988_g1610_i0.p2  ORF type:complete len:123 (-),score=22.33 NODE_1696_length_1411_cov_3.823988_g1610_i0:889-1257(-)
MHPNSFQNNLSHIFLVQFTIFQPLRYFHRLLFPHLSSFCISFSQHYPQFFSLSIPILISLPNYSYFQFTHLVNVYSHSIIFKFSNNFSYAIRNPFIVPNPNQNIFFRLIYPLSDFLNFHNSN